MTAPNGRFRKNLDPAALRFSSSLGVDRRLYREDIEGSLAHVAMLARCGIISAQEAVKIGKGLKRVLAEIASGRMDLAAAAQRNKRFAAEDVHMAIEERLTKIVGDAGGKLHTGRSRNDQIALDERLYLRQAIMRIDRSIRRLQQGLVSRAEKHIDVIIPGYTHLQRAQPILLAHHLLAYVSMLGRDRERFADCLRRVNLSPLGAGALAGTSLPINRADTARALGFGGLVLNSIDAVSDRDVQIEFLGACAITMMHLSRMAEELVLWSTHEWGFVELADEVTTGSSIMPQKKNPDMAELVRGKTGRVYGDLVSLLTVMKGLPLAYNRDMQEDKEPLFDAADTVEASLGMSEKMMRTMKIRGGRISGGTSADELLATELADYLVRKKMPFRTAHTIVGGIVRECERRKCALKDLPLKEYRKRSQLFAEDLFRVLDPVASVAAKRSAGSTSPAEVKKALRSWKKLLRPAR